jgi:hypothetical protein
MSLDINKIKNTKTVTLSGSFVYTNTDPIRFSTDINVEFKPNMIILRNFSIYDSTLTAPTNLNDKVMQIKTNLINNNTLISFPLPNNFSSATSYGFLSITPNIQFRNFENLNSKYDFTLYNCLGSSLDPETIANINLQLTFTLEFVEYEVLK